MLESSSHRKFALSDFRKIKTFGLETVRTAVSWPFIETAAGRYNFDSEARLLDAAETAGVQLVFDLLHFGSPDHVDVFSAAFPDQFASFSFACASFLRHRGIRDPVLAPVNEISYLSWAGGDKAAISPHVTGRGAEFKRNLVRAAVACSHVLLNALPGVRLIAPEPAIYIAGNPSIPGDVEEAADYTLAQFEAWDMLSGRLAPELGGRPEFLDILGVNFYERNEWVHNSGPLARGDPRYRHFSQILADIWHRYHRPMFVAETGTEGDGRADWFTYIFGEVATARANGIPIHGICLYPVVNHAGWDDGRHCHNGLFDYADENGNREVHQPLAEAIRSAQLTLANTFEDNHDDDDFRRPDLLFTSPMGIRIPAPSASDEPLRSDS